MDINSVREVIVNTTKLNPKDITIVKLTECLLPVSSLPLPSEETAGDILWQSAVRYCLVLTTFADKGLVEKQENSTESAELINLHDQSQFLAAIDVVRQFSLHLYLPRELRGLSKCEAQLMMKVEEPERVRRLTFCVAHFRLLFGRKMLALHPRLEDCAIDFVAACYSLSKASLFGDSTLPSFPKERIFRCLLVIKGSPELSTELIKVLHNDLLHLTGEPGGFSVMSRTLFEVGETNENVPAWHKSEVIAKIVCSKGHTKKFYRQVLADCFELYHWSIQAGTEEALVYAGTCIECFKRFGQLPIAYRELHERIEEHFFSTFQGLATPSEVVSGSIVEERAKLMVVIYECYMAFSGSSFSSMPSSLLVPYLHLFLKLYSLLPENFDERQHLHSMIVFCVSNRSKEELQQTLSVLLCGIPKGNVGKYVLHPRIIFKQSESGDSYHLQIGSPLNDSDTDGDNLLPVLVDIIKSSNRNILIYDAFLILLNELLSGTWTNELTHERILLDDSEREEVLCNRFYQKYVLIQSLMDLISHKQFHSQLYDNSSEILHTLTASLTKVIDGTESNSTDIVEIVISIFQEFLHHIRDRQECDGVLKLIQRYRNSKDCSDGMKLQIDLLCNATSSEGDPQCGSACRNALSLCSDQQPYCKVYGTTLLLKLLKERDPETLGQRHTILILALTNLREEESYAFLNSVRLLVALCDVLEADVVDALLKEYTNENNDLDYRLKIGEATIKTVETLGPFAVRYKDTLLNSFLTGTRHVAEEFRISSLANVGNICRILSYQVHQFFFELFTTIKNVVDTDNYLPSRRAAILVLSQLLEGIDGLMDFQEYLLLIYRFLKHVIATEKDDVTKLQAAVALEHLKAKTKHFLQINPDELEKRMFGRVI